MVTLVTMDPLKLEIDIRSETCLFRSSLESTWWLNLALPRDDSKEFVTGSHVLLSKLIKARGLSHFLLFILVLLLLLESVTL